MQIKKGIGKWNPQFSWKNRLLKRSHWDGTFIGCLILISIFCAILAPFAGRSAAPGLQLGAITNDGSKSYISLLITNGTGTNTYEIHTRVGLSPNFPWVGSVTGYFGQTNFSIEIGPEQSMFFRAIDCADCDGDSIPNWMDGNPLDTNVLALRITILSPTNGAVIY